MEPDEKELALKFKNGDMQAFDQLVSVTRRRLYSAVYRMTRNHQLTDEMLQEAYLKLYTSIDKYDDKYPFYPWLYRIAINNTINYLKKEKKRRKDSSLEKEMEEHYMQPSDNKNPYDPEKAFQRQERDVKIMEALQEVSPTYRAALILRVFQGLSYKEIAHTLDTTVGTVMSRLNRARKQMKDLLTGYLDRESVKKSGARSGK